MSSPPISCCLDQKHQLQLMMWRNLVIEFYPSLAKDLIDVEDKDLKQQLLSVTTNLINSNLS